MRLLRSLLWCAMLGGLGIVALLFLIQNLHTEQMVFFGRVYVTNFALALAGAAAFGFLVALLLIVPGRLATALYARALDRELEQLERKVAQASEQREHLVERQERLLLRYERLFADHGEMVAERDRLRAQLRAISAAMADRAARTGEGAVEAGLAITPARREGEASLATTAAARHEGAPAAVSSGAGSAPGGTPVVVVPPAVRPAEPGGAGDSAPAHREARASAATGAKALLPPVAPPTLFRPARDPVPGQTVQVAPASPPLERPLVDAPTVSESHAPQAAQGVVASSRLSLDGLTVPLGRLRDWAARVRQPAGAMYNEMRKALLVRVHAVRATVVYLVGTYLPRELARGRQEILRRVHDLRLRIQERLGQTRQ